MRVCKACGQEIKLKDDENLKLWFQRFWIKYPRKVNKKKAWEAFARINPSESMYLYMMRSLQWQVHLLWNDERFIPHPTTWLNQERWTDEPPAEIKQVLDQVQSGPMLYPMRGGKGGSN